MMVLYRRHIFVIVICLMVMKSPVEFNHSSHPWYSSFIGAE